MSMKGFKPKLFAVSVLPFAVQMSQHFDVVLPIVLKDSICSMSVAVLGFVISIGGNS